MMKKMLLGTSVVVATLMPLAAFAQSTDATYCTALVQKYEQYVDKNSGRVQQLQSLDARAAVEKCKAGDTSGIPAIEKALKNARIDLPPQG